jgi:hypothetical protein
MYGTEAATPSGISIKVHANPTATLSAKCRQCQHAKIPQYLQ